MPTRNVVLTDHHEELIERLVKSGRYQNASEVLRDGIRLMERRDALEAAELAALREAAEAGFRDIDRGFFRDIGDDDLEGFISESGGEAIDRARRAGK